MEKQACRPPRRKTNTNPYRPYIQWFFFLLIALISVNHSLAEAGGGIAGLSSASLHALCPFGGVVTLYQFFTSGTLVQKVHESSLVLMVSGIVLALIAGPVFCGWVCPLGTIQEWVSKIGKKLFKKRFNHFIPSKVDRWLRFTRYAILIWVVYMTATSLKLVFSDFDPYFALFNFWTGEVAIGGLAALGLTLGLSLLMERPWCKYACPYGAFQGIFNRLRVARLQRNAETCINCKACDRACPMGIVVSQQTVVRDHQCIACMECTSEAACPVPATLEFKIGGQA